MYRIVFMLLGMLLTVPAFAFGEQGRWSTGWAQGTTEYMAVVDEHNSLYIACSDTQPVTMMATVQGKEYGAYAPHGFAMIVDGSQYDTPYETTSRVGENNFIDMWEKLRKAKSISILTTDGKSLALPTHEAANVLPGTQTPDFSCLSSDGTDTQPPSVDSETHTIPTALPTSTFDVSWRLVEYVKGYPVKELQLVSHSNNITVQDVIVNRGNCVVPRKRLPQTLSFGDTLKLALSVHCNALEVRLLTDQGEAQYQFTAHP
ncbi:hypothetical protein [Aeromonas veronii]|uniref:hypothetical protein n=1 Tax=Aeromonas veronii TaxID=654 RepID=UPI001F2A8DC4|nr:hypothetical protein [Aeromonas veronii]